MFNNAKKETTEEGFSNSSNIIGKGTQLDGNLTTTGNLRIEGKVKGSIHTKAKVVLGETAIVEGDIFAQNAEIGGEVHGSLRVSALLTLKPTALINGDIITTKLVFEEGAKFNGKCNMGGLVKETNLAQPQDAAHKKNGSSMEASLQTTSLSKASA